MQPIARVRVGATFAAAVAGGVTLLLGCEAVQGPPAAETAGASALSSIAPARAPAAIAISWPMADGNAITRIAATTANVARILSGVSVRIMPSSAPATTETEAPTVDNSSAGDSDLG